MKANEKIKFVRDLSSSIIDDIILKIKSGSVPDELDGIELRWLLADSFARQAYCKQSKEYKNDVLVNNL